MPDQVIEIVIADWEIECCAPPPVIGQRASWKLGFVPAEDDEFATEQSWMVLRHEDGGIRLRGDGIEATYNAYRVPPPEPGRHTLRGYLSGTAHATPDDLPPARGWVRRVRVVSRELEWEDERERVLRWVPGTARTRDVRESPRWFTRNLGPGRVDAGVLMDLQLVQGLSGGVVAGDGP